MATKEIVLRAFAVRQALETFEKARDAHLDVTDQWLTGVVAALEGVRTACGPLVESLLTPATPHTKDEDCTVGPDGTCVLCGVSHRTPCSECGGRGFHTASCEES